MTDERQWPPIEHEELAWERSPDEMDYIPKSRRRKISSTYLSAVPLSIASRSIVATDALHDRLIEAAATIARFDERQGRLGYDLPAVLLRSESSASSQIEQLTSSMRNIALAELTDDAPRNARLVAGNVSAMREALAVAEGGLTVNAIRRIHKALLGASGAGFAGELRAEPVWIGGTPYSPHGAAFVPPAAERVNGALDDLVAFARRDDVDPLTKAAVLHAQFETIHPFIDGNGRTGRALIARTLRSEGLLRNVTLPLSAGLLHDIDDYLAALDAYHEGDPIPIVERLVNAVELAIVIGSKTSDALEALMDDWRSRIEQRRGSRIHDVPTLLLRQPVVDSAFVAEQLGVSRRAARDVIDLACSYGMLRPIGNAKRGVFYQSDELLDVLDGISSVDSIRRLLRS